MIKSDFTKGKLTFSVTVVPRASRSEVVGEHSGSLRVRIAAPPIDGAANAELIRLLAKLFSLPRSAVEIKTGQRGKTKLISIEGGDAKVLQALSAKQSNKLFTTTKS